MTSSNLLIIGIVGLIISIILLVVLFLFLKLVFWIVLVIVLALIGYWIYLYFFQKEEWKEAFENLSKLKSDAVTSLHTANDCDMAALARIDELKKGKLNINDANINGKLFFKDSSMSSQPNGANSTDPYFIERINSGGDQSSLRLTMNDNADESLQIWGNSCATGNCYGPGTMQHRFQADGNVWHNGTVNTKGDFVFSGDNGWILHTPDDGRKTMYVAPNSQNGWDWGKGFFYNNNGYLDVTGGGLNIRGGASEHNPGWQTHFPWSGDNKNYIRGDTEIRGNTQTIGDLTVGRNFSVNNGIKITKDNPGPMLEKQYGTNAGDRYGMGQFATGATRVYAASAHGPATVNLSLAKGNGTFDDVVTVKNDMTTNMVGDVNVGKNIVTNHASIIYNKGRQHIHGEEILFLLNKGGVNVNKSWGGNGNLTVEGNLCVGRTCINEGDLQNIIKKAKS